MYIVHAGTHCVSVQCAFVHFIDLSPVNEKNEVLRERISEQKLMSFFHHGCNCKSNNFHVCTLYNIFEWVFFTLEIKIFKKKLFFHIFNGLNE